MARNRRNAFTLIEVLIVVIIMAVLAATIIPQFSSSTNDAKLSSVKFNLHTIRSQIEMYKVHHSGGLPALATFADPDDRQHQCGRHDRHGDELIRMVRISRDKSRPTPSTI